MQIIDEIQLDYDDVLIKPQITSINHRAEVEIVREFKTLKRDVGGHINEFHCCPIMNANMTQTGTFAIISELLKNDMIGCTHKFYTAEQICEFCKQNNTDNRFFITIGLRNYESEIQKLKDCSKYNWSILIDVPNAYIPNVEMLVKKVRQEFPERIIAVGNVCTGDRTQELIKAGADIIKLNIGASKICRTRHVTGCGRPQLSTVIECANAAHQVGGLVIADGGFNMIGDICKAFVAGADICMSGAMFAGCEESAGEIITKCYRTNEYSMHERVNAFNDVIYEHDKPQFITKQYKEYYGMSSFKAQCENYGEKTKTGTSEGVESKLVDYTGPIINTINMIKGGLRSCGSYIGARNIKNFSRQGTFYKTNRIQ